MRTPVLNWIRTGAVLDHVTLAPIRHGIAYWHRRRRAAVDRTPDASMHIEDIARTAAQRQLDAYNAHDIDAFVACYHENVEVFDLPTGALRMKGRAALHASYSSLFTSTPDLYAALVARSTVGRFSFDREVVTGRGDRPIHAMATYEVDDDGLITRVWFVTG